MSEGKKRKIDSEHRAFNSEWTNKYLFVTYEDKIICLVCRERISVPKEYNLRRHLETQHPAIAKLDQNEKSLKAASLIKSLGKEQQFFKVLGSESAKGTDLSFKISREIAVSGKCFTEGEFVKKCMLLAVSELCPEKLRMFQNISLSRMTVQRRVSDIAANFMNQLKQKVNEFCFYSLAMDESTDCRDTAQLLIYIRGVGKNFNITEELAGMQSMKGRTTGKDICTELINCVNNKLAYSFTNLVAICTDGAPAMCGKHTGAVSLIQEALCGKVLKFGHVMSVVVSIVNYLRARALKHRTFRAFLEEVDAKYEDLVYHTEVRWLSRGRVLQRFVALKEEISQFLKNDSKKFEELESEPWNHDLFFLCDITAHLNDLNMQPQGKELIIFQLVGAVKAFKMKLHLFKSQLLKGEMSHFPTCAQYIPQSQYVEQGEKYAQQIEILFQEFDRRLTFSQEDNLLFKLVEDPFSVNPEEVPIQLQMEVIDLQNSSVYKIKHRESSLLNFYRSLNSDRYKNLIGLAQKTLSIFGSTYICEQTFSLMNMNKNKQRSSLSNESLEDILKISTSHMHPDYDELVAGKRCNVSH